MSHVKLIMEVNSSLSEVLLNFNVQVKSCLNDRNNLFLDASLEFGEMLLQESIVNSEK